MAAGEDTEGFSPFEYADEAVAALGRLREATADPGSQRAIDRAMATLQALERRAEIAEQESMRDPLTDLANRRAWRLALRAETERCRRDGRGAVLAAIDIDDFKTYNDTHGHLAGDLLLRRAADTLNSIARTNDVVARIGGDEFAVIAVGADDATLVGERIRDALDAAEVSASIGVARIDAYGELADAWEVADRAMYREKVRRHGPMPNWED